MRGSPNIYCLKRSGSGTNTLEVHVLKGADDYQTFSLHTGSALAETDAAQHFVFGVADYNHDFITDLYCFKKTNTGTGSLEVHVLNGADNFQTFLLHTGTPISAADAAANFAFALADYNRDGIMDLYCLKKTNTGSGRFEVHVLNGADNFQTFLLHTDTALAAADAAANFDFAVADYNHDGHPDIYCLKKTNTGTGALEVHVLNGADNFQTFLLHTGTPVTAADAANFNFHAADYDSDGNADIYCLKKTNTGSGAFEVHVLSGADQFQTFRLHTGTPLTAPDAAAHFLFDVGTLRSLPSCKDDLFEGGFTYEWSGSTGSNTGTALVLNTPGIVAGRQTIVPSYGGSTPWPGPFDPHVPGLPIVNAGNQSLLLGSDTPTLNNPNGDHGKAQSAVYRFRAQSPTFRFSYAVVLENAGHDPVTQPFFEFQVWASPMFPMGATFPIAYKKVIAGDPYLKTIQAQGRTLDYLPWDCYSVDLTPYLGDEIAATFITANCAYGPHFGYAYIDGFCDDAVVPSFTIPATACASGPSIMADGSASQGETDCYWSVEESDANGVGNQATELGQWFYASQAGIINIWALYTSLGGSWKCNTYYRVKLAVTNHCVQKELVKVIFIVCPPVTAGRDACVSCSENGSTIQLGVGNSTAPGLSYAWSPATGLQGTGATDPSPSHIQGSVPYPFTYTVTVTDAATGCSSSDQVVLYCKPPTVELRMEQTCCNVTLTAIVGGGGAQSIVWTEAGVSAPIKTGVYSIAVTTAGTYTVTVSNPCGIAATSAVVPATSGLNGPFNPIAANSLFSPQNGSPNTVPHDKLYIMDAVIQVLGPIAYNATDYELNIFSRWDSSASANNQAYLVKHITGHSCQGFPNWSICWDGTDQAGNVVQEGVYTWILKLKNCQFDWSEPKIRQFVPQYCVKWFTIWGLRLWCTGYNVPPGTTVDVDFAPQSVTVVP